MPISINNLTFKYMQKTPLEREVLHDISLEVQNGEFVGLIGRTGSGKSTLIQHLNGLLKPTAGTVMVDGINAAGKKLKELRKKVGLVFQFPEYQLFEETVFKDIAYGVSKLGLDEPEIGRRVRSAAEAVGITERVLEQSPFALSGGQKRRVAIAGVLVMEPEYLILDEPGSGLDPAGKREILDFVARLHRERRTTVILVSHNMEDIAAYVERVLVLKDGQIAMDDAPSVVFTRIEELENAGLRPPELQRFARLMRSLDPEFREDLMTVESVADELEKWFGKSGLFSRRAKTGGAACEVSESMAEIGDSGYEVLESEAGL